MLETYTPDKPCFLLGEEVGVWAGRIDKLQAEKWAAVRESARSRGEPYWEEMGVKTGAWDW